jgi:hypothetical protein
MDARLLETLFSGVDTAQARAWRDEDLAWREQEKRKMVAEAAFMWAGWGGVGWGGVGWGGVGGAKDRG